MIDFNKLSDEEKEEFKKMIREEDEKEKRKFRNIKIWLMRQ